MNKQFFILSFCFFILSQTLKPAYLIMPWGEDEDGYDFSIKMHELGGGLKDVDYRLNCGYFCEMDCIEDPVKRSLRLLFSSIQESIIGLCESQTRHSNEDIVSNVRSQIELHAEGLFSAPGAVEFFMKYSYLAGKINYMAYKEICRKICSEGKIYGYFQDTQDWNYNQLVNCLNGGSLSPLDMCARVAFFSGLIVVECRKRERIIEQCTGFFTEKQLDKVRNFALSQLRELPSRECPVCLEDVEGHELRLPFSCLCARTPSALTQHAVCKGCCSSLDSCPICRSGLSQSQSQSQI